MEKLTIDDYYNRNKIERCHGCNAITKRNQKCDFVNVSLGLRYTFCRRKCKIEWIFKQQRIKKLNSKTKSLG